MKNKLKKLVLSQLEGVELSNSEIKNIVGGYDLPEVVVTCGASSGKCYKWNELGTFLGFVYGRCEFTGYQSDYCAPM
ncbi:hypothetical protein FACS1894155_12340 [Bacteroidia bacterium]|nr:hypothetical protein FACS1894155_12340 [Bacteroidia bacterium]